MSDTLAQLREEIDALDQEIVAQLGKRMRLVHRVAAVKMRESIPVVIPERIEEVLDHCAHLAEANEIDPAVARQIYQILIDYACRTEEALFEKSA